MGDVLMVFGNLGMTKHLFEQKKRKIFLLRNFFI
jgi:hypothetical protein